MAHAVKFTVGPTMGLATSRVEFQEGARGEIGNTVIVGEAIQFGSLGFIMDDFKWHPAVSPIAHGQIVPVGDIGIFIGYVGTGSEDEAGNTEQVGNNLHNDSEAYADSIRPIINEDAYYGSDYDSISCGFTEPAGVYMVDGDTSTQNPFTTLISVDNTVI
jgi:hypothetical protein